MECNSCKQICPSCNYDGCYYCPDLAITDNGYECVCSDAGNCEWKRIGDNK